MKKTKILAAAAVIVAVVAAVSIFGQREAILSALGMSDAMTEAEYIEALDNLSLELSDLQNKTGGVDADDVEAAKAHIEELKEPFEAFAKIDNPPSAFAEGHTRIQSGCKGMCEYLDIVKSVVGETDEDKLEKATEEMINKLTVAMNQLGDGINTIMEMKK